MGLGGPPAWMLGLPMAVVYGSLALFISVLHNVFLLYYVDTFVSVYKINKAAFWVGETVFLLWNSLNDPLFGWLSDRQFLSSQPRICGEELLVGGKEPGSITLGQYLRQLAQHRNFLWFVGMDLVQVFHCHFNSNFFPLFLEHLLSDHISLSTGSFLLGISYVAPHLNNLYFLSLCRHWGVYAVVQGLFLLKLGLSLLMLLAGPDHHGLLCLFIASNRVFTEGTCKLLTLVVTDLVDEDMVLNHRKQAASALLFGMVALVTKPGQTFAPLLGTWLLCFYTGAVLSTSRKTRMNKTDKVMISSSSPHWPLWGVPSPGQSPRPHPQRRPQHSARAASTCWCWCPSSVLCCSCSPGPSSRCTGGACTRSKPSARTCHGPKPWTLRQCERYGKATVLRALLAALGRSHFCQLDILLLAFPRCSLEDRWQSGSFCG